MNERGEMTLVSGLLISALTGLVLLCALDLKRSFALLERRTRLFLCAKEVKGEFHDYLRFMGRTNWGIKNINRAGIIMLFLPGLQGTAFEAQKMKKILQHVQGARTLAFLGTLLKLRQRCPIDPRLLRTPFQSGGRGLKRNSEGAAVLREKEWTYFYYLKPYFIEMKVSSADWETPRPRINYEFKERGEKLSSRLSSQLVSGASSSGASSF